MKNIAQSLRLGKSTLDNSFGYFKWLLQYKLYFRGKHLIFIDKWSPTSTVCSCCGAYHKDIVNNLNIREWVCPDCGNYLDRDINAAINIKNTGLSLI